MPKSKKVKPSKGEAAKKIAIIGINGIPGCTHDTPRTTCDEYMGISRVDWPTYIVPVTPERKRKP